MKVKFEINVKFEDLSLPDKLFKYRQYGKPEHLRAITHQEFYFAPPMDFSNHEFNLPTDYDSVTKEDFHKKLFRDSLEVFGIRDPVKRKLFADYHLATTEFFDPKFRAMVEKQFRDKRNNEYGIISMSPYKDNCSLWRNFSANHTGFVIGLKPEFMFEKGVVVGSAGFVTYYERNDPPKLKPFCDNDQERVYYELLNIFSLPKNFEDEQEYRIGKTIKHSGRFLKARKECYSEIIIGGFMNEENKNELIDLISRHLDGIDVYQQHLNGDTCEMSFEKL